MLVVDDEADVVYAIKELLRFDYRVLGATRGREGIEILAQEEVDVVMTDQRMPDMTGVELLHHVREVYPDTTRLLVTGYADLQGVIDAINEGNVYRYITKPWEAGELQMVVRDAVERHDLVVERQRLLAQLERQNEELTRANAALAQANALKSNFIHVASHELRTPLAILLPLMDLAAQENDVPEPVRGWLQSMGRATDRLRALVDQLTTLLAIERFDRPLVRHPVRVSRLLRDATSDVAPFVALRRQVLVRDYGKDLGTIDVDASKIRDCLNQLLLNAVKFTPDGGRITLQAERTADGAVALRVGDTGVGIDEASRQRVFDAFFTTFDVSRHSSGTFEFGRRGLGLGLAVVKAFVEMHGGRVEVASEPGRGSTFTIVLPPSNG